MPLKCPPCWSSWKGYLLTSCSIKRGQTEPSPRETMYAMVAMCRLHLPSVVPENCTSRMLGTAVSRWLNNVSDPAVTSRSWRWFPEKSGSTSWAWLWSQRAAPAGNTRTALGDPLNQGFTWGQDGAARTGAFACPHRPPPLSYILIFVGFWTGSKLPSLGSADLGILSASAFWVLGLQACLSPVSRCLTSYGWWFPLQDSRNQRLPHWTAAWSSPPPGSPRAQYLLRVARVRSLCAVLKPNVFVL